MQHITTTRRSRRRRTTTRRRASSPIPGVSLQVKRGNEEVRKDILNTENSAK